ncbi:rRNA pseudouridine synthase [Patescibacteria group bacterium]|nr:rRNA pseudouridine synthase [Patescibacteria group bacterium]
MAKERLNKFLASAGIASRRKADELIAAGLVSINGKVVHELGITIDSEMDIIKFRGKIVKPESEVIYAFNKPVGVTSTLSDKHAEKTIADFFPKDIRVYPVGRLDKDSCGLILVTNNGELANKLTHPRYEHEKEYEVILKGDEKKIEQFARPVKLDGSLTQPIKVKIIEKLTGNRYVVSLTLKEGRKRQIRRIAEMLHLQIQELKRIRIGKLRLRDLAPGQYITVNARDIIT